MSDFDFYGLCTVLNSEIAFEEHLYSALDLAVWHKKYPVSD